MKIYEEKMKKTALFWAFVLIFSVLAVGFSNPVVGTSEDILLVEIDGIQDEQKLAGFDVLERYDSFVLIRGDENTVLKLESEGLRVNTLPSRTVIHVGGHVFDFTEGEPSIPEDLRITGYEPGEKGIYIVHMLGPIASSWRTELERMDVEVMNYVPNYAYRVRMTPEIASEVSEQYFVDWVGFYHPEYKLQRGIGSGMVEIGLVSGTQQETIDTIADLVGVEISSESPGMSLQSKADIASPFVSYTQSQRIEDNRLVKEETTPDVFETIFLPDGEYRIRAQVDSLDVLHDIARMNDVYYINQYFEPELHEVESQLVGGGLWFMMDDGTPMNEPYRLHGDHGAYINQIGYTGDGVTITIADTGVGDGTTGDSGHPDFTGRVIGGHDWQGIGWQDEHYHGTHCAGLAAGHSYGGTEETYAGAETGPYYVAQGLASDSELYSARIFDAGGGWIGPMDYREIVEIPAQDSDTYVHSNSWGASTGGLYIISDHDFDAAVRDADRADPDNVPMVITVSAGNAGPGYQTTGSPGNAKNVITVGATHTWYPDGATYGGVNRINPENMIGYSSRGWTADNRIKPDIVAPADLTLSTQTPLGMGNYVPNPSQYRWMGGTSSSNPVVAGAAAVVVQWYDEVYEELPSPAMVRSLLINTANELDHEVGNTEGPIPNRDEGWGMIDISKLAYPHDAPIPFYTVNEENVFDDSGQVHEFEIEQVDPDEPLKITLGWTDKEAAPDTEAAPSLVNDLNLEVESPGGHIYRGNAFEGGWSQANTDAMDIFDRTGDGWDDTNNVENVYIPAGEVEAGVYTVRVHGWNIVDDAVNLGYNSQDYALVAFNAIEGDIVGVPPTLDLESPVGGEVWVGNTEEDITWSAAEGDAPLDRVNLFYSPDSGASWNILAQDLDPDAGQYTWTVPNIDNSEVRVRARVIDENGLWAEDVSDDFTIEGVPPEAPSNLLVEHWDVASAVIFEDDVSEDLGYETGSTGTTNLWDIRDHGAYLGDQSWDWGDAGYEKVGEHSWLISPEFDLTQAQGAELTFYHWRNIADFWDGVNVKVSTDGTTWELIEDPDPPYDYNIGTGWGNPIEGQPAWGYTADWEKVTIDLDDYIGETVQVRWDAGVEDWTGGAQGWRIDDIQLSADIVEEDAHNRLRWYASDSEALGEVSHYNIYRSDEMTGPWDETTHIDTVYADGSELYHYIDPNMGEADDIYWWYVVRAVGTNEIGEENEDSKQEPGDPDAVPPEIIIDRPDETSVWDAYDLEQILWTTIEGDTSIDYIDELSFSIDGGATWMEIDRSLDDDGEYEWTVPNWNSDDAVIHARVVDDYGRWSENVSETFEIVGVAPLPAENLDVQHVNVEEGWHWMYPADHREEADDAIGLTGPGYWYGAIRIDLPDGDITDIAYFDWDAANSVKGMIFTDGGTEPGDLIAETEVLEDLGNMQWVEMPLIEPVTVEAGHYWVVLEIDDIGGGFFPFGCIEPFQDDGGWLSLDGEMWDRTIDFGLDYTWTLEVHMEAIDEYGNQDNLITWDSSPHDPYVDPREISHYDIYRAETDWADVEHIATVDADGSPDYLYVDFGAGMADDIFWWYNVTAVAHNELSTPLDQAVQEPVPPEINITSPEEGDIWQYPDTESIVWNITEGTNPVSHLDLYYSIDDGETWTLIEADIPVTAGEDQYEWELPDVTSDDSRIMGRAFDEMGTFRDGVSDLFTIVGQPPEPPRNLLVEHVGTEEVEIFEEDFTDVPAGDLPDGWGRTHANWAVANSANAGGEAPELRFTWSPSATDTFRCHTSTIDTRGMTELELVFQHFVDDWSGGYELRVESTSDGDTWDEVWSMEPTGNVGPEPVSITFTENVGSQDFQLSWVFDGNSFNIDDWYVDDIVLYGDQISEGDEHNLLTWDASEDDTGRVSHYNIYRSDNQTGPWNETTLLDSVYADGSPSYEYLDRDVGEPDGIYWWYVVRSVDIYGIEEENEDNKQEPGDPTVDPPEITIDTPHAGTVWNAYDIEDIEWTTTEGNYTIDYVRLFFSHDGGESWSEIATVDDTGTFGWTVENWPSEEAIIRGLVVDEFGLWSENNSEEFQIIGQAPEPPENLDVKHHASSEWHWMYDADHRAETTNAIGLNQPGFWYAGIRVDLPEGHVTDIAFHDHAEGVTFTGFIHEDEVDAPGEMIGETATVDASEEEEWREIPLIEPAYIDEGTYWVVLEVQDPGDGFFPLSTISPWIYEGAYLSFDGFVWDNLGDFGLFETWTIEAQVEEQNLDHNLITWDASPDDPADGRPEEVTHYDIYRAHTDWEDAVHIGTVTADGSAQYQYVDLGAGLADDIYWWYNVYAVAQNNMGSALDEAVREPMPPEVTLYQPSGGEQWYETTEQVIYWDIVQGEDEIEHSELYYTIGDGWHLIDQVDSHDGLNSYTWTVPSEYTDEAMILVMVYVEDDVTRGEDQSDFYFHILEDDEPPMVWITGPNDGAVFDVDEVTIEWYGRDFETGISHYEVWCLEDEEWVDVGYVDTHTFEDLEEGQHELVVKAVDEVGNEATDHITIYVDMSEPILQIQSPQDGEIISTEDVKVTWTAYDEITAIDEYEIRINEGGWNYLDLQTWYEFTGLDDGEHTVEVRATDMAGHQTTEEVTFIVDTLAPTVDITAPVGGDEFAVDEVTVEWESTPAGTDIAHYRVRLDGGAWIDVNSDSYTFTELSDGTRLVEVQAIDEAGHVGEDTVSFIVDTTPPVLVITSPEHGAVLSAEDVVVEWDGYDETTGISRYEIWCMDDEVWVDIGDVDNYTFEGLEEGEHELLVKAVDDLGNEATGSITIYVDMTPPELVIDSPTEGEILTDSDVKVLWSGYNEISEIVGYEVQIDGDGWISVGLKTWYQFAALDDGEHTVEVRVTDEAGHETIQDVTFVVDTLAPTVEITAPVDGEEFYVDEVTIEWGTTLGTTEIEHYRLRINGGSWIYVDGETYTFSDLSDGTHVVDVQAIAEAGHVGEDTVSFSIDTTPPMLEITNPEDGIARVIDEIVCCDMLIEGNTDPDRAREVRIEGDIVWYHEIAEDGYFEGTVELERGLNYYTVEAEDHYGNINMVTVEVLYLPQFEELQENITDVLDDIGDFLTEAEILVLLDESDYLKEVEILYLLIDEGYITSEALEEYLKEHEIRDLIADELNDALDAYLTETEIQNLLMHYVTTGDLNDALEDYLSEPEIILLVQGMLEDGGYVSHDDLTNALRDYLTEDEIRALELDYITSGDLQAAIEDKLTESEIILLVQGMLEDGGYVSHDDLTNALRDYLTEDEIRALELDYITSGDLQAAIEDKLTESEIILLVQGMLEDGGYVSHDDLTNALRDYLTEDEIRALELDYITSGDLEGTLESYLEADEFDAVMSDFEDDQKDDINFARNLGLIGLILAVVAVVVGLFAIVISMAKKGVARNPRTQKDRPVMKRKPKDEEADMEDPFEEEEF